MKQTSLPALAWIALGFAAVLVVAIASVHHFGQPADRFMSPIWWWMDLAGLAISTSVWVTRALLRPVAPKADQAEFMKQCTAQSERIARELNHA